MKDLKKQLEILLKESNEDKSELEALLQRESAYPFSVQTHILGFLLASGTITFEQYCQLSKDYQARNLYLELFDMAPRTFGETWGEQHILSLFPQFVKATKQNVAAQYPEFDGEFDLWLDGIRIEVKACRANSVKSKGSLASRAYLHSEAKNASFKYHFQQLKPSCCDVFIWIGVCRDKLLYWVLTSDELLQTNKLGPQHRNENTGSLGTDVFEGQVFMTEEEMYEFLVDEADVLKIVRNKGTKFKN